MKRILADAIAGAAAFLPRSVLGGLVRLRLQRIYGRRFSGVLFYTSGRSALHSIMARLRALEPDAVVLTPDYICNVVPRAVTAAGLTCDVYRTDCEFHIDWSDLQPKLADPRVRAIVLASVFGAENTTESILRRIRDVRPELYIVMDECQNLITRTRIGMDERTLLVFSFGLKTVYGAGGGAVAFTGDGLGIEQEQESWLERVRRERSYLKRYWRSDRHPMRGGNIATLEFSRCEHPTYRLHPAPAAGITLLTAYRGLGRLASYEDIRRTRYEAIRRQLDGVVDVRVIETERVAVSPYVAVMVESDNDPLNELPLKGPYAEDSDPSTTLRPNVVCIVNDGRVRVNTRSRATAYR